MLSNVDTMLIRSLVIVLCVFFPQTGSYDDTNQLKIQSGFQPGWSSKCRGSCLECRSTTSALSKSVTAASPVGLNIVAFMPIHKESEVNPLLCGDLDPDFGFQNMLALFYAIDRINTEGDFNLPGTIKLGGTVIDTCENKFSVVKNALSLLSNDDTCLHNGVEQTNFIGFMAMENSDVDALSGVTSMAPSVIISPSSTVSSDSYADVLILRTKSSAREEGQVMADIARRMSWLYVAVITSQDSNSKEAVDSFRKASVATENVTGVCVAYEYTMPKPAKYADALKVVGEVRRIDGLNVIVLLANAEESRFIIRAISDLKLQDRFTFIGSTAWGDNSHITNGFNHITGGSIVVQSYSEHLSGFDTYMDHLTVAEHGIIPDDWFEEFWQRAMQCRLENATQPLVQYTVPCRPDGRLSSSYIRQNPNILQTIIAAQSFALGLNKLPDCINSPNGIAACLNNLPDSGRSFYDATKSILWTKQDGLSSSNREIEFGFNDDGIGKLGLAVANIHQNGTYMQVISTIVNNL